MKYSITILESDYNHLLSLIFSKPKLEGAAYLLCGRAQTPEGTRLLVSEIIPVKDEHYLVREPFCLSICSDSYVPVAKKANELNQSILFVHSHPDGIPDFSPQDNREEPRLMDFFNRRVASGTHGAIVIGSPDSLNARINAGNEYKDVSRVRVIGRRFQFFDKTSPDETPIPNFFDRQVLAFGPDIQRLLSKLHIGIVGVGGTGSAVFEQMIRLGIGRISEFDSDVFDGTNVNRVYGSSTSDVGKLKVSIAELSAQRIGLGTLIHKFPSICYEHNAKALRDCDVIFCCTDKEKPRAILTQLSIRYLIPFFDMGAKIESEKGFIKGIYGRITTFFPGEACLFCRGRISPETIRLEGLPPDQRKELAREGYAPELETTAPAVITFTTAVATQAICEFIHRITGFMGEKRYTTEVIFNFHETSVGRNREKPDANCMCSQMKFRGRGDSRNFLDLTWPRETIN